VSIYPCATERVVALIVAQRAKALGLVAGVIVRWRELVPELGLRLAIAARRFCGCRAREVTRIRIIRANDPLASLFRHFS